MKLWGMGLLLALGLVGLPLRAQAPSRPTENVFLRAFEEPLEALGRPASQEETEALRLALVTRGQGRRGDETESLEAFLKAYPGAPWQASLHLNLGLALRRGGWPGRAMAAFDMAWNRAKDDPSPAGRRIADRAITEWMGLCVKAGDDATLERLLKMAQGRPMGGGSAQRRADAARALYAMQKEAKFYLCGPTSLATVNRVLRLGRPVDPRDVKDTIPGPGGASLFQLAMMASHWDIPLQMAKREPGSKVLVPSVMHWKQGHWAAVLQEAEGHYLVQEDVLEEAVWVRREALDGETSGYGLAPYLPLPSGWERVSPEEGKTIWGRGRVGIGPWFGPYADSLTRPHLDSAPSTTQAGVRMGNLSLEVAFAPLSMPRADGPAWPFALRYQQRITWQPDRFTFSHLGPRWTFTGLSYLVEDASFERQDVHVFTEAGSWLRFTGYDPATGRYARNVHTRDRLIRLGPGRYELHQPDGTVVTFNHGVVAGPSMRRVFRTEQKTPQGRMFRYQFDEAHRLRHMTEDSGKGFTFDYEDATNPWRLSQVRDGHGREVRFGFNEVGQLASVVDAAGGTTRFEYADQGEDRDALRGMVTPEGTWTFEAGQKDLTRWVELVDPAGKRHRAEFRHDVPGLPTTDVGAPSGPLNQYMQDRSTYYWDPEALARHRGNHTKAEAIRYLFNPTQLALSWSLEAVKQAGQPRVWLLYPGQVNPVVEGHHPKPRWVAQTDEGKVHQWDLNWDDLGRPLHIRNVKGETMTWSYSEDSGPSPRTLQTGTGLRWDWDQAGRLTHLKDGKRTLWKAERDANGRILRITDAKGRSWRLSYDEAGRWTGLQGPVSFTWTFDALDRVATLQEGRSAPAHLTYDGLDRWLRAGKPVHPDPRRSEAQEIWPRRDPLDWVTFPQPLLELPRPSVFRGFEGANPRPVGSVRRASLGPRIEKLMRTMSELEPLVPKPASIRGTPRLP